MIPDRPGQIRSSLCRAEGERGGSSLIAVRRGVSCVNEVNDGDGAVGDPGDLDFQYLPRGCWRPRSIY